MVRMHLFKHTEREGEGGRGQSKCKRALMSVIPCGPVLDAQVSIVRIEDSQCCFIFPLHAFLTPSPCTPGTSARAEYWSLLASAACITEAARIFASSCSAAC